MLMADRAGCALPLSGKDHLRFVPSINSDCGRLMPPDNSANIGPIVSLLWYDTPAGGCAVKLRIISK